MSLGRFWLRNASILMFPFFSSVGLCPVLLDKSLPSGTWWHLEPRSPGTSAFCVSVQASQPQFQCNTSAAVPWPWIWPLVKDAQASTNPATPLCCLSSSSCTPTGASYGKRNGLLTVYGSCCHLHILLVFISQRPSARRLRWPLKEPPERQK